MGVQRVVGVMFRGALGTPLSAGACSSDTKQAGSTASTAAPAAPRPPLLLGLLELEEHEVEVKHIVDELAAEL